LPSFKSCPSCQKALINLGGHGYGKGVKQAFLPVRPHKFPKVILTIRTQVLVPIPISILQYPLRRRFEQEETKEAEAV
jgi:hypothetical protein